MANRDDGCYLAREALEFAQELQAKLSALQRQTDDDRTDVRRLGRRVTEVAENQTTHERITHEAVEKLNATLSRFEQTLATALVAPPVPGGIALWNSIKQTPGPTKAKLGSLIVGGFTAAVMTEQVIRSIFLALWQLVRTHWHLP